MSVHEQVKKLISTVDSLEDTNRLLIAGINQLKQRIEILELNAAGQKKSGWHPFEKDIIKRMEAEGESWEEACDFLRREHDNPK